MIKKPQPIDSNLHEKDFQLGITKFGLNSDVKFCSKCIISNQRPNSEIEYRHTAGTKKKRFILMKMEFAMLVMWQQEKNQKLTGKKESKN